MRSSKSVTNPNSLQQWSTQPRSLHPKAHTWIQSAFKVLGQLWENWKWPLKFKFSIVVLFLHCSLPKKHCNASFRFKGKMMQIFWGFQPHRSTFCNLFIFFQFVYITYCKFFEKTTITPRLHLYYRDDYFYVQNYLIEFFLNFISSPYPILDLACSCKINPAHSICALLYVETTSEANLSGTQSGRGDFIYINSPLPDQILSLRIEKSKKSTKSLRPTSRLVLHLIIAFGAIVFVEPCLESVVTQYIK